MNNTYNNHKQKINLILSTYEEFKLVLQHAFIFSFGEKVE